MIYFIVIYCLVVSIFFLNIYFHNKYLEKFFSIFIALLLSILPGLRGVSVGTDTEIYENILSSNLKNNTYFRDNLEPGFFHLVEIFQFFSIEEYFFWSVSFFANFLFISTIFSLKKYRFIALLSYLTFSHIYMMGFNILRQYLAMSIYCFSLNYLFNERKIKHFIIWLISIIFHYSSIFYLFFSLIYLALKKNFNKSIYFICFVLPFIYNFLTNIILEYFIGISGKEIFDQYIDKTGSSGSLFQLLLYLVILFLILIFSNFNNIVFRFYFSIYILYLSFFINITFFNLAYEGAGRLIVNTYISILFVFSFLKFGKYKYIFYINLIVLWCILFYYFYGVTKYYGIFPFKFIE